MVGGYRAAAEVPIPTEDRESDDVESQIRSLEQQLKQLTNRRSGNMPNAVVPEGNAHGPLTQGFVRQMSEVDVSRPGPAEGAAAGFPSGFLRGSYVSNLVIHNHYGK